MPRLPTLTYHARFPRANEYCNSAGRLNMRRYRGTPTELSRPVSRRITAAINILEYCYYYNHWQGVDTWMRRCVGRYPHYKTVRKRGLGEDSEATSAGTNHETWEEGGEFERRTWWRVQYKGR